MSAPRVRFEVLGPVQAWVGGERIGLGVGRRATLAAMLVLDLGRPVGVDRLAAALWRGEPPSTVRNQIQIAVHRLRRRLAAAGAAEVITRRPAGYVLRAAPAAVDLYRFEELTATAGRDDTVARDRLREALGLWRGAAFAGVTSPPVEAAATRWERQRFTAWERCLELELALGRHREVADELAGLVAAHPTREHFRGQLMTAMCRSGRQSEALKVYRDGRRILIQQFGEEPGEALRDLHQRILRADPELVAAPAVTPAPATADDAGNRPDTLPRALTDFTGRREEVDQLVAALTADGPTASPGNEQPGGTTASTQVAVIDGMAGAGKTALAVQVAHLLRGHAPDARLFVDLHGYSPISDPVDPAMALASLLRQLGVPGDRLPAGVDERAALWRSELAGRRALVVLDNAFDAAQVTPLLPGGSHCMVLVTARRRLVDLDAAHALSLDLLAHRDAEELFATVVGRGRAAAEPEAAAEVVGWCGRLPLAVRIAGSRLAHRPGWTVRYLADRLARAHQPLTELAHGERGVAAAFTLSYEQLTAPQQRMFRLFGHHVGDDLDAYLAAAALDIPLADAEDCLEELVDAHLVVSPAVGRYQQHDLIRSHARDLAAADPEPVRHEATTRMLDHYIAVSIRAADQVFPQRRRLAVEVTHPPAETPALATVDAAQRWLETESANLAAAIRAAAGLASPARAWWLTHAVWSFYVRAGYTDDWEVTHRVTLAACERAAPGTIDENAVATLQTRLGHVLRHTGRGAEAVAAYQNALARRRETGDRLGEATTLTSLGMAYLDLDSYSDALYASRLAVDVYREIEDEVLLAIGLSNVANVHLVLGQVDEALLLLEEAAALSDEAFVAAVIHGETGHAHVVGGDHGRAIAYLDRSADLFRKIGHQRNLGEALSLLGAAHAGLGQFDTAREYHDEGLALVLRFGDVEGEVKARNAIGRTLAATGDFEQAEHHHREALELATRSGHRRHQASAHEGIGDAVYSRDPGAAGSHWARAREILTDLGLPAAERLAGRLR